MVATAVEANYQQIKPFFEKIFIHDSYACRTGRGTHFAIARADRFIRRCSKNYTTDCYILKMDIQGFFMAIDKRILWAKLRNFINQYYHHADKELLLELCYKTLANNPTKNCFIKDARHHWRDLPPDKSLFHSAPFCGLPIGNLTSQIFANFYMNSFDHFIKHDLSLQYYGRLVVGECTSVYMPDAPSLPAMIQDLRKTPISSLDLVFNSVI